MVRTIGCALMLLICLSVGVRAQDTLWEWKPVRGRDLARSTLIYLGSNYLVSFRGHGSPGPAAGAIGMKVLTGEKQLHVWGQLNVECTERYDPPSMGVIATGNMQALSSTTHPVKANGSVSRIPQTTIHTYCLERTLSYAVDPSGKFDLVIDIREGETLCILFDGCYSRFYDLDELLEEAKRTENR